MSSSTLTYDPKPETIEIDTGCAKTTFAVDSSGKVEAHGITVEYNAFNGKVTITGDVKVTQLLKDNCLHITLAPPIDAVDLLDRIFGQGGPGIRLRSLSDLIDGPFDDLIDGPLGAIFGGGGPRRRRPVA
jgi:hypothetical protein